MSLSSSEAISNPLFHPKTTPPPAPPFTPHLPLCSLMFVHVFTVQHVFFVLVFFQRSAATTVLFVYSPHVSHQYFSSCSTCVGWLFFCCFFLHLTKSNKEVWQLNLTVVMTMCVLWPWTYNKNWILDRICGSVPIFSQWQLKVLWQKFNWDKEAFSSLKAVQQYRQGCFCQTQAS